MEDAEVMDVVGTLLVVATSQTRICIRITWVWTSRQVDTVERMMGDMLEGAVVVIVEVSAARNRMSERPSEHRGLAYPREQFIL